MRLANEGAIPQKPEDFLHTPYVLEFAGLEDRTSYHKSDLESPVIDKMQKFLLELGKGFCLYSVRSALRSTTKIFMLIGFYITVCCVVMCLLILRQIDILLCKKSDEALVDLTLPEDANIYAKEYKLYLPDKKIL